MERVSDLDALFLAGETPAQHLHVLATLLLDRSAIRGSDMYELLQSRVAERFHLIEPLRRRVQPVHVGRPLWIDDAAMHLQGHLHHVALAEGSGLEGLARKAGDIASCPLSRDRPLWEAWLVDGVEKDQVAVIVKIHHAAVDGVSGIFALSAFFDLEPFPDAPAESTTWRPEPAPGPVEVARAVMEDMRRRPGVVARGLARVLTSGSALVRARSAEAPLPLTGPRLSYNRSLTARRSVAFTRISLDDVRELRQATNVSVNDVLVALCAGVLRRYAMECDELPDRPLVAGVPVAERKAEDGAGGNRFSFMFYGLPVHLEDPLERLSFVHRSSAVVKDLYAKTGEGLFASVAALAPMAMVGPVLRGMSALRLGSVFPPVINVLISNIRGPDIPLFVAGAELTSIFPMGPLVEGVGLGITAVSYRDEVAFGFMACADLVPDVQELAAGTNLEVIRMLDSVRRPG